MTAEPIESNPGKRSTGSWIDDEIIETKALVNLDKASEELAQAHVSVTSFNGVVLLTGQVAREELRQTAGDIASKINKVRQVHNEITVSGTISLVARSNDAWISTKVKSKMLADDGIQSSRIKVVTENGIVYLMGLVTRDEADRAADIARRSGGVQKVVRIFEYIQS
jgi:osmotically-inducible protein OsmY